MHKKQHLLYALLWAWSLLVAGCVSSEQVVDQPHNLAAMYNPSFTTLHPEFVVQVQPNNVTTIMVRVLRDELLFSRANRENKLSGQLDLHMRVYSDEQNSVIFDSVTIMREIQFTQNPIVVSVANVRVEAGKRHNVEVWVRDGRRMRTYHGFVAVDNSANYGGHRYYTSLVPQQGANLRETMNFYSWVPDSFGLKVYALNESERIRFAKVFYRDTRLPAMPWVPDSLPLLAGPDTIFPISTETILPERPGFYFFQNDSASPNGYGLWRGIGSFPELKRPADLIEPLAYLCSEAEFDQLLKSRNQKLAVDEFWISNTRDYTKAKQQIRVFYNRTKFANIYFTSMREGWRTDRGMIFLLFGPPELLTRTPRGERWVYGANSNARTITFDFVHQPSPYTTNHYVLERKTDHRSAWLLAVRTWREGRIFNGQEIQPQQQARRSTTSGL